MLGAIPGVSRSDTVPSRSTRAMPARGVAGPHFDARCRTGGFTPQTPKVAPEPDLSSVADREFVSALVEITAPALRVVRGAQKQSATEFSYGALRRAHVVRDRVRGERVGRRHVSDDRCAQCCELAHAAASGLIAVARQRYGRRRKPAMAASRVVVPVTVDACGAALDTHSNVEFVEGQDEVA